MRVCLCYPLSWAASVGTVVEFGPGRPAESQTLADLVGERHHGD